MYKDEFDPVFSFYLSNNKTDKKASKMIFGGTDYPKLAKKGLTEADVFWSKQSSNHEYWAVNNKDVVFGNKTLVEKPQQVILDNGMSFAMAPEQAFVRMVKMLFENHGVMCIETQPLWACQCTKAEYDGLPKLMFQFEGMDSSTSKKMEMNKEAYMMYKKKGEDELCFLLFSPWKFQGLGAKSKDEEYWVLGAQFLHNYYSVYDFAEEKIGLVESVTSKL